MVSTDSRPPTLTQLLATCAPSSWFLQTPATGSRRPPTIASHGLGGLKWGTPASPGFRVLSFFFVVLEQPPSLLELFREILEAISNAPCSEMARKSKGDVRLSFEDLFSGGMRSATATLLSIIMRRSPRSAMLSSTFNVGLATSSISIEYKRDDVHRSLAKVRQEGALSHIPSLDHRAPVPLQDLKEETSEGADAVATKAIIQCVSNDSRFFLLVSFPFFQIGELVQHQSTHAATARDPVASTSASSASMSAATAYLPATSPKASCSLILQELARWVEPSPTTLGPEAAETLGTDLSRRSLIVSFIALAFTAVNEVLKPDEAVVDKLLKDVGRRHRCSDTGARSLGLLAGQPPLAQAKDPHRPVTPSVSVELQSDLSPDPLMPVTRICSSPPASTN
ncbi:BQ5605_C039g11823 [Microbotryum silenes-dioicae]|uniref:BQ5605_C039g11823 protein n=1 Tax=Microbotryum silenes-dioicae TaxID=796604 RepID=A0A2X0PGJ1_9BASI|nr:BQ5605_C039g11823 [Microbotryum silenes-dioicae]